MTMRRNWLLVSLIAVGLALCAGMVAAGMLAPEQACLTVHSYHVDYVPAVPALGVELRLAYVENQCGEILAIDAEGSMIMIVWRTGPLE